MGGRISFFRSGGNLLEYRIPDSCPSQFFYKRPFLDKGGGEKEEEAVSFPAYSDEQL